MLNLPLVFLPGKKKPICKQDWSNKTPLIEYWFLLNECMTITKGTTVERRGKRLSKLEVTDKLNPWKVVINLVLERESFGVQ